VAHNYTAQLSKLGVNKSLKKEIEKYFLQIMTDNEKNTIILLQVSAMDITLSGKEFWSKNKDIV